MSGNISSQKQQDDVSATSDTDDLSALFRDAAKRFGKAPFSVIKDWLRLVRGPGNLTIYDYFRYQLYDDSKHDSESRRRFVSDKLFWPIVLKACDSTWKAALEDKTLMYALLNHYELPTLTTLAIVDNSERHYGKVPVLSDIETFSSFLGETENLPVFMKPVQATASSGAMVATHFDGTMVDLKFRDRVSIEELYNQYIANNPYLLQRTTPNHPEIDAITPNLATVRFYNFMEEDGLRSLYPMMKIPAGESVADNFWRKGNLLAAIDETTGCLTKIVQGAGLAQVELSRHPESDVELLDMQLPHWDEVRALNEKCARMFAPVRFTATDLAITPDGPIVVEVNYGGSFALPQILYNTSFLTDERKAFFPRHGWKF